jgi:hypothetical protein
MAGPAVETTPALSAADAAALAFNAADKRLQKLARIKPDAGSDSATLPRSARSTIARRSRRASGTAKTARGQRLSVLKWLFG